MSYDSGLGSNSVPYEYSVEVKNKKQKLMKVAFLLLYAAYIILVFTIGVVVKIIVPFLALIPLTTWIIVWFTWRYTQLSYEYSFFKGEITVNRVYGMNNKKIIVKVRIKDLKRVRYINSQSGEKMPEVDADRVIFAARSYHEEKLAALSFTDGENKKQVLFLELDEKAQKIIHYYNSAVA